MSLLWSLLGPKPPSKEFCENLAELNRLSGNKILGPLPRCAHGLIACLMCSEDKGEINESR